MLDLHFLTILRYWFLYRKLYLKFNQSEQHVQNSEQPIRSQEICVPFYKRTSIGRNHIFVGISKKRGNNRFEHKSKVYTMNVQIKYQILKCLVQKSLYKPSIGSLSALFSPSSPSPTSSPSSPSSSPSCFPSCSPSFPSSSSSPSSSPSRPARYSLENQSKYNLKFYKISKTILCLFYANNNTLLSYKSYNQE